MPVNKPHAVVNAGGIKALDVLNLIPGLGRNALILGRRLTPDTAAIGSVWVDTETANARDTDYSQVRLARAGVSKWRFVNNRLGGGNDLLELYSDVADDNVYTVDPVTRVLDFAVAPTVAGSPIAGSGTGDFGTFDTDTPASNVTSVATFRAQLGVDYPVAIAGTGNALIAFFSNTSRTNPQHVDGGGVSQKHAGWIGMGSDNGLHMSTNAFYKPGGTYSPQLFEPNMPRANVGFDSEGVFSYTWDPACVAGPSWDYRLPAGTGASGTMINQNAANADRSNTPYQPLAAQSFVIMGGGYDSGVNPTVDKYNNVWLATMRNGQAMTFATTPSGPNASPIAFMQGTAGGNLNIFRLAVIGGTAGIPNIRLQSVGAISPAVSGQCYLWYDGTNLKASAGLTVVTLA